MPTIYETIDAAIDEATAARKRVAKIKSIQVRGVDEIATLKATAQTWFHTHRPIVVAGSQNVDLTVVDRLFTVVLDATLKYASKTTYLDALKDVKAALIATRNAALVAPVAAPEVNTDDLAPDFSPLAGNQQMRDILTRRWNECAKCVRADAHLAAIVMMGGLLEALFVARANKMPDKTTLTSASNAPKDKATGKTTNYQEWMLDSYIKVGFELKWITESAKDVADKLKEYRNFIHPAKELRYGVTLDLNDSSMFWQVTKALTRQLLLSA
ncbi:hypothetical protein L6654_10140 [Bradyrhizobium sp. WYCCWR 13023]|uniref:Uncharacterized protein n=1 Tax=Bradyrhizobium zhengyangense TaxID=2911009 RepID=A0A9X1U924_9BRAD|nr:hypothetical protein [Bradyrhizobium zhengyangense]MCG2626984.1 hypothetical protein [Bradyrhizobium zhengyangense]